MSCHRLLYALCNSFQVSVSWGATPQQDAIYAQIGMGASPVYVTNATGAVVTSFIPNHGVDLPGAIVYDTYQNSYVMSDSSGDGAYAAIRVSHNLSTILMRYPVPPAIAISQRDYANIGTPAVDGTGQTAITFTNDNHFFVGVYDATGALTAYFQAGPQTYPIGLAFVNGTLYTQNPVNAGIIDMFSPSGQYRGNFSVPALGTGVATFGNAIGQLTYVPTAGRAGALWTILGDSATLLAIDLATHVSTVMYTTADYQLYYFGLSPSRNTT